MMDTVVKFSGGIISDLYKDSIKSQKFADVALCCSDGQRFLTHRLILSAASPYLYEVLRAHGTIVGQCEVITVILAEVEGNDLEAILDFLYTGSAMIPKSRLEAFSSAADALRIKIPPLPFALTLPNCPTDHFNHYNNLDYKSNIVENNSRNYLKVHDAEANNPEQIELTSKIMPTQCLRQLLASRNYRDDDVDDCCMNLKAPEMSSKKIGRLKSHVANRVIASPWCQLDRPHHSPKVQPIVLQNCNLLSSNNNCEDIPSAIAFSSKVPVYYSSFTHERLSSSLNEMTVGVKNMHNPDSHDPTDGIPLDYPQDMSRSAQITSTFEQNHNEDDNQSLVEIIHSPNINLSSLDQSQCKLQHEQSSEITPTNDRTVNENKKISLNAVGAIRWSDGNNNNSVDPRNHEITFTNDEQHKCHICQRTFINRTSLRIHSRSHSSEKPFRCLDCGKEFSQLRNYKYHRSVHEGTGEFAGTCPECGKCFNDRGYLGSHMKIHRNRKEYVCQECGKSFNQRVAYNMHVRIHTGVKPHHCEQCGKAFSRKMLLKQHLRTHSGERPYQCHICHKAFADRSNMTLHTRLHSGLKPYQCDICSKAFTKKHHLKTHLNYHTGTKPYSCPNCSVAFSQSSNMRTHYKKCMVNKPNGRISDKVES